MRSNFLTVYCSPFTINLPFTVYDNTYSDRKQIIENVLKTVNRKPKTASPIANSKSIIIPSGGRYA